MQNEIDLACIKDELCKITAKQLNIEEDTVNENSAFLEDLGADSLDIVELLAEIEIKYGIYVPDESIADIKTISDAADYVFAAVAEKC
ncbi:MAG: acyl carrier protein [Clostridia bacterium]|nr:acyl carrier protein [Clostridia bacterium]